MYYYLCVLWQLDENKSTKTQNTTVPILIEKDLPQKWKIYIYGAALYNFWAKLLNIGELFKQLFLLQAEQLIFLPKLES